MSHIPCRVFMFLSALEGDWRNAIYIECGERSCPHAAECSEILFAADADGQPILLPAPVLRVCGNQEVDKRECTGRLEKSAFISAYRRFLDWHTDMDGDCVLRQFLESQPFPLCGSAQPSEEKTSKEVHL